jgi:hypothetical protein
VEVVDPSGDVHGVREATEVSGHGHDQGIKRAACSFLTELAGGEAEDVAVDAETAHVLIATAKAGAGGAPIDKPVYPGDGAVPVDDGTLNGAEDPPTTREDGEMVSILEIRAPSEITVLECGR